MSDEQQQQLTDMITSLLDAGVDRTEFVQAVLDVVNAGDEEPVHVAEDGEIIDAVEYHRRATRCASLSWRR